MNLSRRERIFIAVGAAVVILFGAWELGFQPLWSKRQTLATRVARAERQFRTVEALAARHRRYGGRLAEMEGHLIRRDDKFSLFAFLEEAAGKAGIRDRLVAMTPSEASASAGYRRVELHLRFEDLTMPQLVRYLQEVSTAPRLLRVGRMSLERSTRTPGRMRVTATVVAFAEGGTR